MAVISPSALIGEIAGSVGTECFGRNMGGAYVRTKPVVPYLRTTRQAYWRNFFKFAVIAWQGLTDSQRQTYIQLACDYQSKSRIGRTCSLSGYTLFLRQQQIMARIASPLGFSNPSKVLQSTYNVQLHLLSTSFLQFNVIKFESQLHTRVTVKASPLLSPGIMHANIHKMNMLANIDFTSGSSIYDLTSNYTTLYGSIISGKRIAWAFSTFHDVSGEATEWQMQNSLVP